ncbi:MAG: hypothetical protein K5695_04655 [Oscillospiraceae bacterium]|nr:hypothetical protein [Oscillospiraceae bacterium]
MKKATTIRRILAGICAAVLCGTAAVSLPAAAAIQPVDSVHAQAGELKTRNVHIRTDNVNTWESEHFKFYWGNSGDSAAVTESFLQENAKNLEACWDVYMNDLHMNPPTQSVEAYLRDGNEYKVNFYIHNTGLLGENGSEIPTDWAYMGYDREGYAFMFCCVGAMNNSPNPSWVLPHEFGHVVTAHQYGWNSNKYVQSWWEAIANWYREQFLYSDYYSQWANVSGTTDYFMTYMQNLQFTPILGRDNYASWAFLQYLTENPDNLGNYGAGFVKDLMQQGQPDEYPYLEIERIGGADIKDTLGHYAKRLATLDLARQDAYLQRQRELIAMDEMSWNQIYTVLDKTPEAGRYTVPTDRAPQQFGVNLIPLQVAGSSISVTLESLTDAPGADWRACIVVEQRNGKARYSDLFKAGETMTMAFDANQDTAAYLTVTATPDSDVWQKIGTPWAYAENTEFGEENYPFLGKTRYPYAVQLSGAEMQQQEAASVQGSAHPNGGGFVAASAHVDASVYVGKNARVLGNATVSGNARIDGYATVSGRARVSGDAVVTGHAIVSGNASVTDNAIIGDSAYLNKSASVSGNARVLEGAMLTGEFKASGNATLKGTAFCWGTGSASGQAILDGDYYIDSDRVSTFGTLYGWTSADSYAASRPYTDGQLAGLEFSESSSKTAADTYTSTYAAAVGSPEWAQERTSGKGVLTFADGQYLIADSSYATLHDADYQTAVLLQGDGTIFRFGDDAQYIALTADQGTLTLAANDGSGEQTISAENAYTKGQWVTISAVFSGDTAKLVVNNGSGSKEFTGAMTVDPVDAVTADAAYTIGKGMTGSMDFFRVNFKEVPEPEYYYTGSEDVTEKPAETHIYGDMDENRSIDVFDLGLMKRTVLSGEQIAWADCDADGMTGIGDIIAVQKYVLAADGAGRTGKSVE